MTVHPYRLYVRTNWDDGPDPTLVGTYRSEEEAEEALKLYLDRSRSCRHSVVDCR